MAPELTGEAWAQIRHDYEHTERPVAEICAAHGISTGTLRDRVRRWRWKRRREPIPLEGPPPLAAPFAFATGDACASFAAIPLPNAPPQGVRERTAPAAPDAAAMTASTNAVAACPDQGVTAVPEVAANASPEDVHAASGAGAGPFAQRSFFQSEEAKRADRTQCPSPHLPPAHLPQAAAGAVDEHTIVQRLESAVARVLPAIEATLPALAGGVQHPREMERAARMLAALTRTLRELNRLLSERQAAAGQHRPPPRNIEAMRAELARKLQNIAKEMEEEKAAAAAKAAAGPRVPPQPEADGDGGRPTPAAFP